MVGQGDCCQVALASAKGQQRLLESQLQAAESKSTLEIRRLTSQLQQMQVYSCIGPINFRNPKCALAAEESTSRPLAC